MEQYLSELRLQFEKETGKKYKGDHFYKSSDDPYVRFLEEKAMNKEEEKKSQNSDINKIIKNEL